MAEQDGKRVIEQQATSEVFADDWFLKDSVTEGTTKISSENLKAFINEDIDLSAEAVSYDNTSSGLEADNVQDAIDEVLETAGKVDDVKVDGESVVDENKVANIDLSALKIVRDIPNTPTAIATFSDGANLPMPKLEVGIEPVQSGSGDPSPTNIRPISGWDEVNVGVVGKNLLDNLLLKDQTAWNVFSLQMQPNTTYTVSSNITYAKTDELPLYAFRTGVSPGSSTLVYSGRAITLTTLDDGIINIQQRRVSGSDSFQNYEWQVEFGSTATTDEPYNGQTYTLDLDGTRYGGKVDLISGAGNDNRNVVIFDGTEPFVAYGTTFVCTKTLPMGLTTSGNDIICSHAVRDYINFSNAIKTTVQFKGDYFGVSTVEEFKALLASWVSSNKPLQFSYELATPFTIQLPPTVVKSLEGVNNISADSGDVIDGKYIADASLTIASLDARITALENQ